MYIVEELRICTNPKTRIWVSEKVKTELLNFKDKIENSKGHLFKKLKHYAENGFSMYTGKKGKPIRFEWEGVYRIGLNRELFRIIGFFDGDNTSEFIAIDAFLKKKQKLSQAERDRIDVVVKVKRERLWKRRK